MQKVNGGKEMKDVWTLPAIQKWEKACGKHPTQKPLVVAARAILAATKPGAWILDLFAGASTTGIAPNLLDRKFVGIDREADYLRISRCRKLESEQPFVRQQFRSIIGETLD